MTDKLRIYACGGFGVNIASGFGQYEGKSNKGYADMDICYIDTSRSNMIGKKTINEDKLYILEGIDGSGKKRDQNYGALSESVKDILHQYKPSTVNIVLHSASGGSGSVIGPILVSELVKRGDLVIPVIVGSNASRIEVENTLKTLKSYENISKKCDHPVVACYKENSKITPRGKVDNEVTTLIMLLAVLFSGQNRELDKADLNNFINYHRVTDFQSKLNYLDFWSKTITLEKGTSLITVATLCDDDNSPELDIPVEYQCVGYIMDENKEVLHVQLPIHAGVIGGYFNIKAAELDVKLEQFKEARQVVIEKSIIGKEQHDSTDEGLIL